MSRKKEREKPLGFCYLLHFTMPYPKGRKPQHYLGWAKSLKNRLRQHLAGKGAKLTRACLVAGITWEVAAVWPDAPPQLEKDLKRRRRHRHYCPVCAGKSSPEMEPEESGELSPRLIVPRLHRIEP